MKYLMLALCFVGCGGGNGNPSGVGGDGGGGGSDAGTGSGTQDPTCAAWLSCAASYVPGSFPSLLMAYGPNGTCWSSTPSVAMSCVTACATSLMQAQGDSSAPSACRANLPPLDMSVPTTAIVLSGDAASGFGPPQVLTMFSCDPAEVVAAVANNFPTNNAALAGKPLLLIVGQYSVDLDDTTPQAGARLYTQNLQEPPPWPRATGTIGTLMLGHILGNGAVGSLTATGSWVCP